MSTESIYGFPCVENPHDFSPDRECCTVEEIAFWEEAKHRWDAGERDVRGARCGELLDKKTGEVIGHATRTSWGIGINEVEVCDKCGLNCICEQPATGQEGE